jgi:hypothetical protein
MTRNAKRIAAGAAAVSFFLIHGAVLVAESASPHLLWCCHLGCLLVGIGLLRPYRWTYAVGTAWMVLGVPLWLLNVFVSREFMPTSLLSHMGGLLLAFYGLNHVEIPRHLWLAATTGLIALAVVTRLLTPPAANINLAFSVWAGWETVFPSYFHYALMMLALAAVLFFLFEITARRWQDGTDKRTR